MSASVHIIATGARTPAGLASAPAAAAVRAQISALGLHPFMVDQVGEPMPGALDALLEPGMFGPQRLVAMSTSALREACATLAQAVMPTPLRIPVFLGLPEPRPGFSQQDGETVRSALLRLVGLPIEIAEVNLFIDGHAAGLSALAAAHAKIRQGLIEACLVGGADSYFHPDTMEWLDGHRQLAGAVSRSGFVPGEGAGFCLLMAESARRRLGLDSKAQLLSVAMGRETKLIKTPAICLGEGLTKVVQEAIRGASPPAERISDIICDINGERYRGEEWGFVCLRLPQYFNDPTAYRSPADCWGDMGAASGPLFMMLACQAAERGYAKSARSLVWAGSENGLRGAVVLGWENIAQHDGNRISHG